MGKQVKRRRTKSRPHRGNSIRETVKKQIAKRLKRIPKGR